MISGPALALLGAAAQAAPGDPALAPAPALEGLLRAQLDPASAGAAMACSSVRALMGRRAALGLPVPEKIVGDPLLRSLIDQGATLDAPLQLQVSALGWAATLGHGGDADALEGRLGAGGTGWTRDGDRFRRDDGAATATLQPGQIQIAGPLLLPPFAGARPAAELDALLQGIPEGPGCAFVIRAASLPAGPPALQGPIGASGWIPLEPGPLTRITLSLPPGTPALPTSPGPGRAPLSAARADIVAVVQLSIADLAAHPPVAARLPPAAAEALGERAPPGFGAGSLVGFRATPDGMRALAAVPLDSRADRRFARALRRGLRRRPPPDDGARPTHAAQTRGWLILGDDPAWVDGVDRGAGAPLASPALLAEAAGWAIYLRGAAPLPGLPAPLEITIGAELAPGALRLGLRLDPPLADPRVIEALKALRTQADAEGP